MNNNSYIALTRCFEYPVNQALNIKDLDNRIIAFAESACFTPCVYFNRILNDVRRISGETFYI